MLKKTITYTDYNGVERTNDFYFNLSRAEIVEMELLEAGGMGEMLKGIVNSKDVPSIMKQFKQIIMKSYGEKSPDGLHMVKSDEISRAFIQTEAYSVLFMELFTDTQKASDFINAIIPNDMRDTMAEADKASNVVPISTNPSN